MLKSFGNNLAINPEKVDAIRVKFGYVEVLLSGEWVGISHDSIGDIVPALGIRVDPTWLEDAAKEQAAYQAKYMSSAKAS